MTKKLYVGNLSFQTSEGELEALFAEVGAVESVTIINDRDTGRSKGFGFVVMSSEDADKAIERFNGKEFNGRALTVNEARPMAKREFSDRSSRGGGGGGGRGRGGRGSRGGY
jgi:RNA recognition motif-containing protein